MSKVLPKWLMVRYVILLRAFEKSEFSHDDAAYTLQDKNPGLTSVVLSSLKRAGWLMMRLDPSDSRKRIYSLKSPERAVHELEVSR